MLRCAALAVVLAGPAACAAHARVPGNAEEPVRTEAARPQASRAVRDLRADLDKVFHAAIMSRATWGVDIRSLDTGERLYELNAGKLMMPASNMKIMTLSATAEALGWDYRYTTTLETSAPIEAGVLRGDLIVGSTGDPTINTRGARAAAVFDQWATALHAAGISAIDGRIIGNDQAFDDEGLGAGWAWDYLQAGYAAPVGALQYNEDAATLTVTPAPAAGQPPIVSLMAGSGYELLNYATTGPAGSPDTLDYRRHSERPVLEIVGSIPAGAAATRTVAVVNPTVFFAQGLKDALAARGISVSGSAVDFDDVAMEFAGRTAEDPRVIVSTQSPPLRDIATVLMKVSQNLYAETFLKTLARERGGLGTAQAGLREVNRTLGAWGVPDDARVIYDGSGLSRYNYLAPSTITTVLEHMYKDPRHRDAFLATLPIGGKDGSLSSRFRRTRAEGNALAKTGSIANVRSLSGFLRTRDGEMLVFSILANDFIIPAATVNYIADVGVEYLANFTRK